jgi:molybdopterin molybdotransferase
MTDSCSSTSPQLLSVKGALEKITNTIKPVTDSEKLPLKNALNRVLSETIYSPVNIPSFKNSAMDGYAICSDDIDSNKPFQLQLAGVSAAGKPYAGKLLPGQCIRILTGAVLPDGADSVIMQEHVKVKDGIIQFPESTQPFINIRYPGEDISLGNILIQPPKKLTAIDLGLLAAAGIDAVHVKRQLKIAFLLTGDELAPLGTPLQPGQIYDSNRYALNGLLAEYHAVDLGVVADNKNALKNSLLEAAIQSDMVITTGGASVGDADYIKPILDEIGEINFWKIAFKPGKPLAFGQIGQSYFFGLPGNPVSVIVAFHQFVAPALRQLSGAESIKPLRLQAECLSILEKKPGRQEFQRGILTQLADGKFTVKSAGQQGSNILSAFSLANCYILLPADCAGIDPGEQVEVEPFNTYI